MEEHIKHVLLIIFNAFKLIILLSCVFFCILQSYYEIQLYTKHQIYTATSVMDADVAPVHLVFCDSYPLNNKEWYGFIIVFNCNISVNMGFLYKKN